MARNLESTRQGRIWQGMGVFFMLLGVGIAIYDRRVGEPWWVVFVLNAITISLGLHMTLYSGRRMVNSARSHRAFMDDHRAAMRRLDDMQRQREWN